MTTPAQSPSAGWTILNTEPGRFSAGARAAMEAIGRVTAVEARREYLLTQAARFDVFFVGLGNIIDREILNRATDLKCIVTPTTGTDHIDAQCLRERGIDLLSLKGETEFLESITATAELTWGLLLSAVRQIVAAHNDVMGGAWSRDRFGGIELQSKTLGIVGYGRLGRMVASYAKAFRMEVVAYDLLPDSDAGVAFVPIEELLSRSHVVSVHLPLDDRTAGFLSRSRIASMRDGSVLVNTSRGAIVDEEALLGALQSGKLAAAALDVMADETSGEEWVADNPLVRYAKTHQNLVITPHIGGMTAESADRTNLFMIAKLKRYLQEREMKRSGA